VDELSRDLQAELSAYGVTVENQAPFYVATKMSKIRRPRLDAPSPTTWVRFH
jgi:17beta-estradiol 17-dehydrogenase / very-long-chain 3-oxoacyl-CoA reductase